MYPGRVWGLVWSLVARQLKLRGFENSRPANGAAKTTEDHHVLESTNTEKIRRLHNCVRHSLVFGGQVLPTAGVAELDPVNKLALLNKVRSCLRSGAR